MSISLTGYRVHVAIFRGDTKASILRTMAQGRQAVKGDRVEAVAYAQEFADMAAHVPGQFAAYGAVIVQCQITGEVVTTIALRKSAVAEKV